MAQPHEVDLPPNLSCLKSIDTLLRCPICFEFLNITMMTQCSHNFCSLCIRKFLSYKLLCPVCNLPSTEQDLRNNRLLDDLVQSFQAARQKGLKKEANTLSNFFQKKTPLSEAQKSLELRVSVKSEPMEVYVQPLADVKQENVEDTVGMVKDEKMDVTAFPSTSQNKLLVKVDCPVCGVGVPKQNINKHLDMCLSRDDKKEGLRSSGRRKAMPKLLYTLITVPKLKKMLKECHLSAQGSREQLVRRHQEFTHIYNAQCDSLNPRSAEEIAKEVENNERLKNKLDSKRKPVIVTTKNQTAEEIEELHSVYRKQHSSEFSRLIAQVRGRLETSKRAQIKQEEKSTEETDSKGAPNSVQNTPQPLVSAVLKVKSEEMDGVIELPSRSSSPTISEVSISSSLLCNQFPPVSPLSPFHHSLQLHNFRTSYMADDWLIVSPVLVISRDQFCNHFSSRVGTKASVWQWQGLIFSVEDLAAATQNPRTPTIALDVHPVNKAVDQTEKWRDTHGKPEAKSSQLQREVSTPIGKMFEHPVKRHYLSPPASLYIFAFSDYHHLSLSHVSCISLPSIIYVSLLRCLRLEAPVLVIHSHNTSVSGFGKALKQAGGLSSEPRTKRDVHTQTLPQILLKTLLTHSQRERESFP
ncbi:E3 ubiquitin-protein ligase RAD18 [Labeo rohita]|uniref:RING-type E3 ubiquitin transferase n=1 Tax=Labeo rohita TaxID=84645 RepID=A0ABQ8MLS4_LABRO|nr:E3 ubiquitin-protein ligase RAD18 [Labeo rohita]